MDYPKFIVSNQKEESISIQRVKTVTLSHNLLVLSLVENSQSIKFLSNQHLKGDNYATVP